MIVLNKTTPQTLKVIPREFVAEFTFSYEDDSTNISTEIQIINATTSGNYLTWSQSFIIRVTMYFILGYQKVQFHLVNMKCVSVNLFHTWSIFHKPDMVTFHACQFIDHI